MNEYIDLTKILKNCPKGTKFYSPVWGEVSFERISDIEIYVVEIDTVSGYQHLTKEGCYIKSDDAKCILFPSKEQRDWSKFTATWHKKEKFDPKTLKPFDRVLARIDGDVYYWFADFVSAPTIEKYDLLPSVMSNKDANMIIPYNDETKHLVGTKDEAPEYYRYWEE